MADFSSLQSRYERDPAFRNLVSMLEATLHALHYTPSELREAVMYAATRFEMLNPRSVTIRFERGEVELDWMRERAAPAREPKGGV